MQISNLLKISNFYIRGGFVRDLYIETAKIRNLTTRYKDVDIILNNQINIESFYTINWRNKILPIDITVKQEDNYSILKIFKYTNFSVNEILFDGKKLICTDNFLRDMQTRNIVFNPFNALQNLKLSYYKLDVYKRKVLNSIHNLKSQGFIIHDAQIIDFVESLKKFEK